MSLPLFYIFFPACWKDLYCDLGIRQSPLVQQSPLYTVSGIVDSFLGAPSGDVALGGAVTVQCRGRHQIMRFLLYQDGNPNVLQDAEPAGDLAEFPIRDVSQRDAGSYSCYHHDKVYPFTWSHPSDPVELVVAGELPGSVSPVPAPHPAGPSGAGTFLNPGGLCLLPLSSPKPPCFPAGHLISLAPSPASVHCLLSSEIGSPGPPLLSSLLWSPLAGTGWSGHWGPDPTAHCPPTGQNRL
uniref:Ig-like domain-containing protein n=1 Tax=Chrysemys picta bellii TaxID=8478 RepID=A0A8C3HZL6_CHRPI